MSGPNDCYDEAVVTCCKKQCFQSTMNNVLKPEIYLGAAVAERLKKETDLAQKVSLYIYDIIILFFGKTWVNIFVFTSLSITIYDLYIYIHCNFCSPQNSLQ